MKIKRAQTGQSMLEALIAIAVILIGLISIITLAVVSIKASTVKSGEVVALNLAREGLEITKNLRDTNWLNQEDPWTNKLVGADHTAVPYFDYTNNNWSLAFDETADVIVYKTGSGIYYQSDTHIMPQPQVTLFSRYLVVDLICYDSLENEQIINTGLDCAEGENLVGLRILSRVSWVEGGKTHQVELEDRLYNWKPNVKEIY